MTQTSRLFLSFLSLSVVLFRYGDEGHAPKGKVILPVLSLFLLSIHSFYHHGLKFCSLIEVTVCLVVCISIRLTSAFLFLLSLTLCLLVRWSKTYFPGIHLSYSLSCATSTQDNAPIGGGFYPKSLTVPWGSYGQSHRGAELRTLAVLVLCSPLWATWKGWGWTFQPEKVRQRDLWNLKLTSFFMGSVSICFMQLSIHSGIHGNL